MKNLRVGPAQINLRPSKKNSSCNRFKSQPRATKNFHAMALSKPVAPFPYSSYHSNEPFDGRVIFNYEHLLFLEFEECDLPGILKKKFLTLMAGNYQMKAHLKLSDELKAKKQPYFTEIIQKLAKQCDILSKLVKAHEEIEEGLEREGPDSSYGVQDRRKTQMLKDLPAHIEAVVTPMLSRLNEINFGMYERFSFHSLEASLLAYRTVDALAQRFIMDFFHFSCYALPSQRVRIIELGIRRGAQLLREARATSKDERATCLWIAVEYYSMAKASAYNVKFGSCRIDDCIDGSLSSLMGRFTDRMHQLKATDPRARLCDILVHMRPIFSYQHECALALACALITYPRPGKDKRGNPITVMHLAGIGTLGTDLIRQIWDRIRGAYTYKTNPIQRKARRAGRQPKKP